MREGDLSGSKCHTLIDKKWISIRVINHEERESVTGWALHRPPSAGEPSGGNCEITSNVKLWKKMQCCHRSQCQTLRQYILAVGSHNVRINPQTGIVVFRPWVICLLISSAFDVQRAVCTTLNEQCVPIEVTLVYISFSLQFWPFSVWSV